MAVTFNPIVGPDAGGAFNVPSGKALYVPLTAVDAGQTVSYSVLSSSNPNVQATVLTGNPTLKLTVHGTNASNAPFSGTMTLQLFENLAPNTVHAIESLVNAHKYDGLTFYRIIDNFVAQFGAMNPADIGAPTFNDEFNQALAFTGPGILAMANSGPNTNSSELFITDIDVPLATDPQFLSYRHSIFGILTSGFDVYNNIMHAKGITAGNSTPSPSVIIDSATIVTDTQNGVLQITEPNDFTGNSVITVTATSTGGGGPGVQSFTVNAAPSSVATNSQPLILTPVTNKVTTVNTPVSFQLSAIQAAGITSAFSVTGTSTFRAVAPNVSVQVTPARRARRR